LVIHCRRQTWNIKSKKGVVKSWQPKMGEGRVDDIPSGVEEGKWH